MKTIKFFSAILLSLILLDLRAYPTGNLQSGKINPEFQKQLGQVVYAAGELSDNFASGEIANVDLAVKKVMNAISATDMELLTGNDHMTWMQYTGSLNEQLNKILDTKEISLQRDSFSVFNDTLHKSVKEFGIQETISYYQFCPMARNNQGAFWFSNNKEIKNPYFGSKMLTCGSTKEVIQ